MSLRAPTAIVILVAQLITGVASGLVYLCEMDGQTRRACCCPADEQASHEAAVSKSPCCAVSLVEPSSTTALATDTRASQVPCSQALALDTPAIALDGLYASAKPARFLLSAALPIGPPLYLRHRVFLI